jgi:hypothetical protein
MSDQPRPVTGEKVAGARWRRLCMLAQLTYSALNSLYCPREKKKSSNRGTHTRNFQHRTPVHNTTLALSYHHKAHTEHYLVTLLKITHAWQGLRTNSPAKTLDTSGYKSRTICARSSGYNLEHGFNVWPKAASRRRGEGSHTIGPEVAHGSEIAPMSRICWAAAADNGTSRRCDALGDRALYFGVHLIGSELWFTCPLL